MGKTITLNFDHLSPSDRKIVLAVAARAEKNRKRIERNREIIRRLKIRTTHNGISRRISV